jgi:S-disulfanyl-L-cysteine oxidoreductase SoxD
MSPNVFALLIVAAIASNATILTAAAETLQFGIGRTATRAEIEGWDVDVRADGQGLPEGRGSVRDGQQVYAETCAACHGEKGEGKLADRLVGGFGTLATTNPVRTVGSFWPYATTLFDYIRRAMPYSAPQSLTANQVYAVTAYILYLNNIVPENTILDAISLPKVVMPNHGGFTNQDPRPDVP